jgi:hypothetical protein
LQPEKSDVGDVDGVPAVYPDESEWLEQRRDVADWPDVNERRARTQANFGFSTAGLKAVHVIRVERTVLTAGDVTEDPAGRYASFLARLGHGTHGLVARNTGWSFGQWLGVRAAFHVICLGRPGWSAGMF